MRKVYWVCGEEDTLIRATIDRLTELLVASEFNCDRLFCDEIPETEVWSVLDRHPIDTRTMRLIVVYGAERLKHLDRIGEWLQANKSGPRRVCLVFVAAGDEAPEQFPAGSNSCVVRCSLPQAHDARRKRAVEILTGWGCEPLAARAVLDHVGYDLSEARHVIDKAKYFPKMSLSREVAVAFAPRSTGSDFVSALLALRKRDAVAACADTDISLVLGSLATHVQALSMINRYLPVGLSLGEIAHATGLKEGYVRSLHPYARFYPRREAMRRTFLLERLDHAHAHGADDGVLEALIAAW